MENNQNLGAEEDFLQPDDQNNQGTDTNDLTERIRKDNEELDETSGSITTTENMGDSILGRTQGTSAEGEGMPVPDNGPANKNQLGDNPPGSEERAFEAGSHGDMNSDQVKYQDSNIIENFRENIDKTKSEIELDKDLKGGGRENT
ncbi:hypothetical protein [Rubrolithibacter danxiaensis]|uniref:hypothetical protein n=1 Tax=Rubrolithibacter danxiaensis TaxID=3390805 RepID=UPI003BF7C46A